MAGETQLVTVFRSADADAEEQAAAVRDVLLKANLTADVFDDSAAGVPEGAFEVRVPSSQQADAEQALASQTDFTPHVLDVSHDLDMVAIFRSETSDAELLTTQIRSVLDAHEIPSVLVSGSMFPSLPYEVRVPKARLEEARQAIAAAEEAGPAAAEEAERESETETGTQ